MPSFLFLCIYEDSSYKSSSMKSAQAAAIMFVSVARHHSASKTFEQMCTALTFFDKLEVQKLALNACLSEVVPRTLGLGLP